METINKHNYEAFFLDYHEGNLSDDKKKELTRFLQQNPSLKEEFEDFEEITLEPSTLKFENKQELIKKTQAQHYEITEFEYLCVSENEKDITDDEEKQLIIELKKPENKKSYNTFKKLKLQADEDIIFTDKKLLQKKTIPINYGILSSVAAAAVILLFFVFKGNFLNQNVTKHDVKQYASKIYKENNSKPIPEQTVTSPENKNIKQGQTLVTHNQTIKNSKNVLAFDDNEPQKMKDLYKELIVSIPDIKNEALISNINQKIKPVVLSNSYAVTNITPTDKKDKFWKYAEKGVDVWKKITKDDDVQLVNEYADNGSVNEVNFMASNFQFRKTYNKK